MMGRPFDLSHIVEFIPKEKTILIELKVLNGGEVIESLEVPGSGHEAMLRAVRLGDALLQQQKKSLSPGG